MAQNNLKGLLPTLTTETELPKQKQRFYKDRDSN